MNTEVEERQGVPLFRWCVAAMLAGGFSLIVLASCVNNGVQEGFESGPLAQGMETAVMMTPSPTVVLMPIQTPEAFAPTSDAALLPKVAVPLTPTNTPEPTFTYNPTPTGTSIPTATQQPTFIPTKTALPTATPTRIPEPTATNTSTPTPTPSPIPTHTPTVVPTSTPTPTPVPNEAEIYARSIGLSQNVVNILGQITNDSKLSSLEKKVLDTLQSQSQNRQIKIAQYISGKPVDATVAENVSRLSTYADLTIDAVAGSRIDISNPENSLIVQAIDSNLLNNPEFKKSTYGPDKWKSSLQEKSATAMIQLAQEFKPVKDSSGKVIGINYQPDNLDRILDRLGIYPGECIYCYGKTYDLSDIQSATKLDFVQKKKGNVS